MTGAPVGRETRLGFVLGRLLKGKSVSVDELKTKMRVDERTARSDLLAISQLRIRRSRGQLEPAQRRFHDAQRITNIRQKREVAEAASTLFDSSSSIAASPGSTVAVCYGELIEKGISPALVTNSLALIEHASADASTIYVVGGEYSAGIHAMVGTAAARGFEKLEPCRYGLLGLSGILTAGTHPKLYLAHAAEIPVVNSLLQRVLERVVIVATVEKLGKGDPWLLSDLGDLTQDREVVLVTNEPREWKEELGRQYERSSRAFADLETYAKSNELFSLLIAPRGRKPRAAKVE